MSLYVANCLTFLRCFMATDTWTGAAGDGNWNTAGNWSDGVPTSDSDVVIDTDTTKNQAITISGFTEIGSLTVSGTTGLTIQGSGITDTLSVDNNVSLDNDSGGVLFSSLVANISGNVTGSGATVIIKEASVQVNGATYEPITSFWPVRDSSIPNTLGLYGGQRSVGTVINFSTNDMISFGGRGDNQIALEWISTGNNTYEVVNKADPTDVLIQSVTLVAGEDTSRFTYDDTSGTINCFLAGSLIETPEGLRKIEDMQVGDAVCVYADGKKEVSHVTWAGHASVQVNTALKQDEAAYPIRILANALADNVPSTDLLITPEHCLFFNGKFVPARMLVNGGSIFYDTSITSYEYYHIETEQHAVIMANGVLTESYLDTGNRASFQQSGTVVSIGRSTPAKSWAHDAAAPLCVDRAFVEPLFHALNYRKNSVAGCHAAPAVVETTTNPDLHLVTQSGAIVHPMRRTTHQYSFMLPPNTQSVRIVSRASRPADVIGPFVDDRRYMGVAIADIHLLSADDKHIITAHLQTEKPAGWYATEPAGCVWTNGNAVLPLDGYLTHGNMGMLSMTVQAGGPYIVEDRKEVETQAHSA
ncbi:Hint domain-containing protein [Acetobacter pasteurianus]